MASTLIDAINAQPAVKIHWNHDAPKRLKDGKKAGFWLEYQSSLALLILLFTFGYIDQLEVGVVRGICGFIVGFALVTLMRAIRREGRWGLK